MAIQLPTKRGRPILLESPQVRPLASKKNAVLIIATLLFLSLFQWGGPHLSFPKAVQDGRIPLSATPFEYEDITPSESLVYHDCFEGYQCARLSVPLDWNSTAEDGGPRAALAIIKKPAPVPITDPRYGGVILLNPGGPGGSGVSFVFRYGDTVSTVVNAPTDPNTVDEATARTSSDKYFDLLSWDPRGVNHTTPAVQCFSDSFHRESWNSQLAAIGLDLSDDAVFSSVWSRTRALSASCSQPSKESDLDLLLDGEHVGQFTSTANVVRDMVEIIERHGEWREKAALKWVSERPIQVEASIDHLLWQRGEEKLQYWGFSYGTVLGQTFASMQPHRIYRHVLDGVVDAQDYTHVDWSGNLQDIDLITRNFTQECYDAGPDRCALYNAKGPDAIAQSIDLLFASLRAEPIMTATASGPAVVDADSVIDAVFNAWYSPTAAFRPTASLLASLIAGNGSAFAARSSPSYAPFCSGHSSPAKMAAEDRDSGLLTIHCTDGDDITDTTQADFKAYVKKLNRQSPTYGNLWSTVRLACTSYSVRAKWRFPGPYGSQTAHPILFASQTLDPVTPLRNAIGATALFPGSGVLDVDGMGHTTLAMPSVCGAKVIRKYFQTGEIEDGGKKCPVDRHGFDEEGAAKLNGSDGVLLKHLEKMAETWPWQH